MTNENFCVPTATITEKPDAYELRVMVPGVGKEDADLHVEGRTLVLKTHATYQNPAGFKEVTHEFDHDNYALSVDLPEMADTESLKAKLENGLLVVTIVKKAESQARKIAIA